jgi:hypothetical protein
VLRSGCVVCARAGKPELRSGVLRGVEGCELGVV